VWTPDGTPVTLVVPCWSGGDLKRERVIRVRYRRREEARADLFEYIEVFYNRKRRHGYLGNISPVDFEKKSHGSF